jgi:hypothetical protein
VYSISDPSSIACFSNKIESDCLSNQSPFYYLETRCQWNGLICKQRSPSQSSFGIIISALLVFLLSIPFDTVLKYIFVEIAFKSTCRFEDYKKVENIKNVSIGTHCRYFTIDSKTKQKVFRLGGNLNKIDPEGRFVVLTNGTLSWSVQIPNSTFYQKMTEIEVKDEMKKELKKERTKQRKKERNK